MINKFSKKSQIIFNAALFLISVACVIASIILINNLYSQKAAQRYRGDSETQYSQLSVFLPSTTSFSKENVNTFRLSLYNELKSQLGEDEAKFIDAFSCVGSVKVSSDKANSTVQAIAVDGDFFDFHPLNLLSGSYITSDDKDINRVVLDEETAWLLFGSYDVSGLSINIGEEVFFIAGVIDREDDIASQKAFDQEMGIFMTYTAFSRVYTSGTNTNNTETAGKTDDNVSASAPPITCYEVVIPNPVKNFAYNIVSEEFPEKNCEIVQNTTRFSFKNILSYMKDPSQRVIASSGIAYPYWENAARYTESKSAALILSAMLFLILPILAFLVYTSKNAIWTTRKIKYDITPIAKAKASDYIRKKERIHWEKKNLKTDNLNQADDI